MATLLVGGGGVLYTQAQIKEREVDEAHRLSKVEMYKKFLDMISKTMAAQNPNLSITAIFK